MSETVRQTPTGCRVDVRVIPRSPRTSLGGLRDGRLVVRVTAPPVDQAANDAVIRTLADALDFPRSRMTVVAGLTSRNKTIEIAGADAAAVRRGLAV